MKTKQNVKMKFKPSSVAIFEEADGYYWSDASLPYLDARGKGHPSKAAAMRAAREDFEMRFTVLR